MISLRGSSALISTFQMPIRVVKRSQRTVVKLLYETAFFYFWKTICGKIALPTESIASFKTIRDFGELVDIGGIPIGTTRSYTNGTTIT